MSFVVFLKHYGQAEERKVIDKPGPKSVVLSLKSKPLDKAEPPQMIRIQDVSSNKVTRAAYTVCI